MVAEQRVPGKIRMLLLEPQAGVGVGGQVPARFTLCPFWGGLEIWNQGETTEQ
jgi:hypothetical protein